MSSTMNLNMEAIAILGPAVCGATREVKDLLNQFHIENTLESLAELEWSLEHLDGCIDVSKDHIEASSSAVEKLTVANRTQQSALDKAMIECEKGKPLVHESIKGKAWEGNMALILSEKRQALLEGKRLIAFYESVHDQISALTSVLAWESSIYKFLTGIRKNWQENRGDSGTRALTKLDKVISMSQKIGRGLK